MLRPVAIYNDLPTPGNDVNIGLGYNLAGASGPTSAAPAQGS